jgi:hypothetical protein
MSVEPRRDELILDERAKSPPPRARFLPDVGDRDGRRRIEPSATA